MITLGLTGGIGAGKSTAAQRLRDHGAVIIDYDQLAREVVAPGSEGLAAVVESFGDMVAPEGVLDRQALAKLVFFDERQRTRLNGLLHPLIRDRAAALQAEVPDDAVVVHEIALLAETDVEYDFDHIATVEADIQERTRRLVEERGMDGDEVRARIDSQATRAQREAIADTILCSDVPLEEFYQQVDQLWAKLTSSSHG